MSGLEIKLVSSQKELEQILEIRRIVFIDGQGVSVSRERDGIEADYFIALYNGEPAGCMRVRFIGDKAKIERVALLPEFRDRGFGKKILDYAVDYCKRKNVKEIISHAQIRVKGFYEKCGFKSRGETFIDAGIEHIEMYLKP